MEKNYSVLELIVEKHFFINFHAGLSGDLHTARTYKNQLGKYFGAVKYLVENDIFSQILFFYHNEKISIPPNIKEISESIANKYYGLYQSQSDKDLKELVAIIGVFYSIVIENFNLHFDVGDVVKYSDYGTGSIIQILKQKIEGKESLCYRIQGVGVFSVDSDKYFKLIEKKFLN